ncbi:LCP family protein [Nocardiopsis oceani]
MPADENSADPGEDHARDETPDRPEPESPEDPESAGEPDTVVIDTGQPVETSGGAGTGSEAEEAPNGEPAQSPADESAQEAEDVENTEDIQASGDTEVAEGAQASGDTENSGDTEKPEDAEKAGDAEEAGVGGTGTGAAVRTKRKRRRRRVVLWVAASLALIMCAGAATAYGYYHFLRSGMVQHDIDSLLADEERPEKINDAVNVLFIGSDGYEEDSPAYTEEFEGERSDSLMLAHISPDNRVSVISFPRDSLVQLPECDAYGQTDGTYGYFGMINSALYHGGPPCVLKTVETLTDIRVDHFVHLSFASFRDVVDAIGGVEMCIPEPMEDDRANLDLDEGQQTLDGEQALSFVRARYEIGDGGDIGRIDRQQMFLAALADQATSSDVLTSPSKLNGILQAVAQHSATDRELTLDRMVSLAVTMADVDLSDIEFHTVPWYPAPYDPNRVMWNEEDAAELFEAVRENRQPPELLAADDSSTPQEPPTDAPTPADMEGLAEDAEDADTDGDGAEDVDDSPSARAGEGRDATSNPCDDGLGFGTDEDDE